VSEAFTMHREVLSIGPREIVLVDTIAHLRPEDAGRIVATGSHGGVSSGEYASRAPIAAVFFNDAGIGCDEAGIAGLAYLQQRGIAAGAVAHTSAMIGDSRETWGHGVISALNPLAVQAGFRIGAPLEACVRALPGEARDAS
jgi:hypothetical protein